MLSAADARIWPIGLEGGDGSTQHGQSMISTIALFYLLCKRLLIFTMCIVVCCIICSVGGHFMCKLFDVFTRFSVGLVYLMYRAFEHVALFKPVTSRPANSERYAVSLQRILHFHHCLYVYIFTVQRRM